MRIYGKVKIAFWEDEKISVLGDSAKLLALYCLTGEHSNAIGCYRLPLGYIQTDLKWNEERARECLQALIDINFVMYDEEMQFILISNYLEHNPIENSRVGKMCIALVNAAMRSKIFPYLVNALLPHKHRFILNDKNLWQSKWDTSMSNNQIQNQDTVSDTVSDVTKQDEAQAGYTVCDTVSDTLYDTVSDPNDTETAQSSGGVENPGKYTVSDRVFSSCTNLVAPEPEPEPRKKEKIDDDARAENLPVLIIKAFDEAIVEIFGKELERPYPYNSDMQIAREFIQAGADLELCRSLFLKQQNARKRKGQFPIGSLLYFRSAVPDAVNERNHYKNNPLPEKSHEQRIKPTGGTSRPRSGHDAFTEAMVEVVLEREEH
jgi:hypothetical protein